jgi:O-antigen ligase
VSLARVQLGLVAAVAATCLVSIFAAQLLLALAVLVYLARVATGRTSLARLPVDGPVLAFAVWTLLSASFAPDPLASYESAKKLVLFALLYVAVDSLADERARERVVDAAILGGLALVTWGLVQYYLLGFDVPDRRPRSFLGHYMTASGLAMGVLVLAAARLAFRRWPWPPPTRRDLLALGALGAALAVLALLFSTQILAVEAERLFVAGLAACAARIALGGGTWPAGGTSLLLTAAAVPMAAWALVVSQTRNAWLGALAGLALVAVLRARWTLWLLAASVAVVLVLRPPPVMRRLTVSDASSVDRYYMWQAGIDMIAERPVFGQGPGMILAVYPEYRWPQAPNPRTPHLHNNALQIAAERGVPCLAWWIWLVASAMAGAWREARRGAGSWGAAAAFGVLTAVIVGGMFEYNFGDSEVLMFTLLVSALPFALRRQRDGLPAAA